MSTKLVLDSPRARENRAIAVVADYLEQRHDYGGYAGASRKAARKSAELEASDIWSTLVSAGVVHNETTGA